MPTLNLGDLEEVDYDPFKKDRTAEIRAGGGGTLSAGNPSWGDRLAGGFSNAVGLLGATPTGQKNAYDVGQTLTGIIPGVSNAVSGNQAYRDFGEGNYLSGILNTAAALPIPGSGLLAGPEERAFIKAYHGSPSKFRKFNDSFIGSNTERGDQGHGLYFSGTLGEAHDYAPVFEGHTSHVYHVTLPHDPKTFMDWGSKFADQPQNVKDAVAKLGYKGPADEIGKDLHENLVNHILDNKKFGVEDDYGLAHEKLSKFLHKNGVPGIQYPGEGDTNNYVMFSGRGIGIDKVIKVKDEP